MSLARVAALVGVVLFVGCGSERESIDASSSLSSAVQSSVRVDARRPDLEVAREGEDLCVSIRGNQSDPFELLGCAGPLEVEAVQTLFAGPVEALGSGNLTVVALPPDSTDIDVAASDSGWWIEERGSLAVIVVIYPVAATEVGNSRVTLTVSGSRYVCSEQRLPLEFDCRAE